MGIYDSSEGFNKINPNEALGDPETIAELNEKHENAEEGEGEETLDELLAQKSKLEYQIPKTFSPDREELQKQLDKVNEKIAERESQGSSDVAA